jgi:hypothetical protein
MSLFMSEHTFSIYVCDFFGPNSENYRLPHLKAYKIKNSHKTYFCSSFCLRSVCSSVDICTESRMKQHAFFFPSAVKKRED